jgi:hypothetical protein
MTTGRINQVAILVFVAKADKTEAQGQVMFHSNYLTLDACTSSEESVQNNRRSSIACMNVP